MTLWDYLSYGPQNPVLAAVSRAGQTTGVQAASKKVLTSASQAGAPVRAALGYGDKYSISQGQAGQIGFYAGSLVVPGVALERAGAELVGATRSGVTLPGLLEIPGATKLRTVIPVAGKAAESAGFGAKFASKLPSLGTVAKIGAVGTVATLGIAGMYVVGKTAYGIGQVFGGGDGGGGTKKGNPPSDGGGGGYPGGGGGYPGGGGGYPGGGVGYPGGGVGYPGFDPYAGFWGNLGAGLGGLPAGIGTGAGTGLADIGTGTGASIVPLAIIAGAIILGSKYIKKGKRK